MDKVILGRTGFEVSAAGLGAGGYSRLGLRGGDPARARRVIETALDLGITLIDTARIYGTEEAVGAALAQTGARRNVVLSSKVLPVAREGKVIAPEVLRESLEKSLRRLRTDHIEIFFLHGVPPDLYRQCADALGPELEKCKQEGKIGAIAVSEFFSADPDHKMLQQALKDDLWDVFMVGLNCLNPSAAKTILPRARARKIGTLIMFAARHALTGLANFRACYAHWKERGLLPQNLIEAGPACLDFLAQGPGAPGLPQAAYRWCRHIDGADVILTGTGNPAHLRENAAAICAPPLDSARLEKLNALFGDWDRVSADSPAPPF